MSTSRFFHPKAIQAIFALAFCQAPLVSYCFSLFICVGALLASGRVLAGVTPTPAVDSREFLVHQPISAVLTPGTSLRQERTDFFRLSVVGGEQVAATLSYDETNQTVSLVPSEPLTRATNYEAVIDTIDTATSTVGEFKWKFRTSALEIQDFGPVVLDRNDDNSAARIDLPFPVSVYGNTYNSIYINNNGNITFNSSLSTYTAFAFPGSTVIVAGFFSDVDTRGGASGVVHYKNNTDSVVITWDHVGYYSSMADKRNTFQIILTSNGLIGFSYDDMQWTTGSASGGSGGFGGSLTRAGFDAGNSRDAVVLWEGNSLVSLDSISGKTFFYTSLGGSPQANTAPVANAGSDQTIDLGTASTVRVQLDGSGTTDDGIFRALTYSWRLGDQLISSEPTANLNLGVGVHDIVLSVFDGQLTSTDTVQITITDTTPPETWIVTAPSEGATVNDSIVNIDAGGSDNSTPVSALTFSYAVDGIPSGVFGPPTMQLDHLTEGSHTLSVFSKDASGNVDPTPVVRNFTVDRTSPIIDSVNVTVGNDSANLRWISNEPSRSTLIYSSSGTDPHEIRFTDFTTSRIVGISELIPGTTYTLSILAVDVAGNESSRVERTFTIPPAPDLIVTDLAVTESNLYSGNPMTVTWNVRNQGTGSVSEDWNDRITIVNTTTGQTLLDHLLAYSPSLPGNSQLEPSTTLPRSFEFTLPAGETGVGSLQIRVTTDSDEMVYEYNSEGTSESNNALTVTRQSTLPPDTTPPQIGTVLIDASGINISFVENNPMLTTATTQPALYQLVRSGGDGVIGDERDVAVPLDSAGFSLDAATNRLSIRLPLVDDLYHLVISADVADAAGNTLAAASTHDLMLNAYGISLGLALTSATDTGISASDAVTRNAQPEETVTWSEPGKLELDWDGDGSYEISRIEPLAGQLSHPEPSALADGSYTRNARFTGVSGEQTTRSLVVRIDATAPTFSVADAEIATRLLNVSFTEAPAQSVRVEVFALSSPSGAAVPCVSYTDGYLVTEPLVGMGYYILRADDLTDTAGNVFLPANFSVRRVAPVITSLPPPSDGRVGVAYSHQCTADGMPPLAFSASGLPPGLTINSAGAISGTPTVWGTFNGTITAANGVAPNATQAFSITMVQPPVFTSAAPPADGKVGTAYTHTCTAEGNTPVGFTLIAGALPTGLILSESGVISGIPEAEGTFTGTLRADNGTEPAATQDFSITIIQIPVLSLVLDSTVVEGGTTTGTLSVAPIRSTDMQVTLSSSRPTQLNPGPPIIIPAGQASVPFTIRGIQDNLIEAATEVRMSASAAGASGSESVVMLLDDDWPILTLEIDRNVVSEAAGSNAVVVTLSRDTISSQPLTVWLTNTDPSSVSLPETVIIPADDKTVSFPLSVLDDTVADGPQSVTLRAEVRLPGVGMISQSPEVNLEVGDDEGARLEFVIERDWVLESGSATASVRRLGGDTSEALTVHLAASPSDELTFAATVEIPAGAEAAEFSLGGVVDGEQDGNTSVRLEGSATGYSPAQTQLVVTDRMLADLVAMNLGAPSALETEANFRVSYRIENQGAAATSTSFTQRVLLSKDPVPGNDTLLSQYVFSGPMIAGTGFDRSETVRAPREAGTYWLIVVTDATQTQDEIFESNNTVLLTQPLTVGAAYEAVVSTDASQVPANTPIVFSGAATRTGGAKVPHVMVNVHIRVAGTERIISAITDSAGNFTVTWQPLPGEGGDYEVGACHPGVAVAATQDTFAILTVKSDFPGSTIVFDEGTSASFTGTLTNPTSYDLIGLTLVAVNPPAGLTVDITLPATTLAARQTAQARITLTGGAGFVGNGVVQLRFATDLGVTLDLSIPIQVRPLVPQLVISPASLKHSVLRGEQKSLSFQIANTGGAATGKINILLPDLPWLQLASPAALGSLAPGESTSVSLLLAPSVSQALSVYTGSLVVDPEIGSSRSVPFEFRVVSALTGDFEVEVVDESYFFTAAAPKVAGAAVMIRDAISSEQVAKLDTPAEGRVHFPSVPEGWYRVEVTAPDHTPSNSILYINAGETNFRQIFISRQWVTYNWKVEEIEIEDHYRISVETTFETNVPAPVVTISPGVLNVEDLTVLGQSKVINFTIENHGLIAADHGNFGFDQHPFYEVTPLIGDIGLIPAKSSITIPVTVRKIGEYAEDGSVRYLSEYAENSSARKLEGIQMSSIKTSTNVPCGFQGKLEWDYICGVIPVPKWTSVPVSGVQGDCSSGNNSSSGSGGWWSGGSGSDGGGGAGPGVSVTSPVSSECPCFDKLCITADKKIKLDELGDSLAKVLSAALPPWLTVEDIDFSVQTSGELCFCCVNGEYGFSGSGTATASVTGSAVVGRAWSGEVELDSPGWTDVKANATALAGVRVEVTGEIGIEIQKECLGEGSICLSGSVSTSAVAGIELQGEASATYEVPNTNIKVGYEGNARGALLIKGSANATASGCLNGDVKFEACASFGPEATLQFEMRPVNGTVEGEYPPVVSLGGSMKLPKWEAGTCAKASATSLLQTQSAPSPVTLIVPGSDLLISDQEAMAKELTARINPSGVCATVKVKIDQEAVMTRSAFRGTLELSNNRTANTLKQVGFDLDVRDSQGNDAREFFNIQVTKLAGLAAIDGTGEIGPQSTGSAQWTLIPRDTAAPLADTVYTIGGTIRYNQDGVLFSIPVTAVPVTVKPDAALYLKYFHQRDVFSDDPHTAPMEPAIPYALAVMVENRGAGSARNLRITSAQPEIVDNEKGLLIDFQIIGTEVAGQNFTPSLTATFGEILPNQCKIANWWMTSSLQGLFIDYKATFEHLDGLGDPRLSLIKDLEIHELIHLIEAQGELADGLPDFLVNDVPDVNDFPDTVHLSSGGTAPVAVYQVATFSGSPSQANPSVTLTSDLSSGWVYLRIPDPANGSMRLTGVRRSDGRQLSLDRNAWTTDRTFVGLGQLPVREPILHLVDIDSTGSYTLTYENLPGADTTLPSSQVAALPPQSGVSIPVSWAGSDDQGIASFDIFVQIDGDEWQPWLTGTTRASSIYQGTPGRSYGFYSRCTDRTGNVETQAAVADALTLVAVTNTPPIIIPIPPQIIPEGNSFVYQVVATDPDDPFGTLSYAVDSSVPGITIDQSGQLRWLTSEADGGSEVTAVITVTDSGSPQTATQVSVQLIVAEVNLQPTIQPVGPQYVEVGDSLNLEIAAEDPDVPQQTLVFGLADGKPSGMTIDDATGHINWTPSRADSGRSHAVTMTVTDSGTPPATGQISFAVSVPAMADQLPIFERLPNLLWLSGKSYVLTVHASDPDGDPVTIAANLSTLAGTPIFTSTPGSGNGTLTWEIPTDACGTYDVPLVATAGSGQTQATIRIRVEKDEPYWQWVSELGDLPTDFDLTLLDMDSDADADGCSNVFEMAFLRDPLRGDATAVKFAKSGTLGTSWVMHDLSILRHRDAGTYVDLWPTRSTDLATWAKPATGSWQVAVDPNGDTDQNPETREVRWRFYTPVTSPKSFFRIEGSRRP